MIPVQISKKAVVEIRNIIKNKNIPTDYGLRIGVKGARGCAGVSFMLGFDKKKDDDLEYTFEELDVYIRKKELLFLMGKEIDYYDGGDAKGFVFNDPEIS